MKRTVALLLIAVIYLNSAAVFGQRKAVSAPQPEKVQAIETGDSLNRFSDVGLPVAYVIGGVPSDQMAAKLAAEISKYDEASLAILTATLQKAGFYIIDRNQKTLYKPTITYDMEMAFYDFEVAGMLKASGNGMVTTVEKLASLIRQDDSSKPDTGLGQRILEDVRAARKSKDRRIRFFGALIYELGKQFPTPVDLDKTTPETSTISMIQASLIERVMLGDLISAYTKLEEVNAVFPNKNPFKNSAVQFENVGFARKSDLLCDSLADVSNLQKSEKTVYKLVEKILTFRKALNEGLGPDGKISPVKVDKLPYNMQKQFLEKFGTGLKTANIVLSWVKLLLALSSVKIELKVEEPLPLIRTKSDRFMGEVREATAKFTMDLLDKKKTDFINCASKAFEIASGLKFSVPQAGSMKDKPVAWELITPGRGVKKYLDSPVYLDALTRSDTSKQMSDANGESKVKLTGKPQAKNLETLKVVPVRRTVDLKVSVALERMKFGDDVGKLGKVLLEEFGVKLVLGIIEVIPEMIGKMKLSEKSIRVPIRDWTPCSEDWGGLINFKRELAFTRVIKSTRQSNGNGSGDGIWEYSHVEEAEITLNPRNPEEMKTMPPKKPWIYVNGRLFDVFTGNRENDPCCGSKEGNFMTKFRKGTEETYSDAMQKDATVNYRGSERDFSLALSFFSGEFPTKRREFMEVTETTCDLEEDESKSEETDHMRALSYSLEPGRYGERFVNSEGELLQGQKQLNMPDGAVITWSWALARCKD